MMDCLCKTYLSTQSQSITTDQFLLDDYVTLPFLFLFASADLSITPGRKAAAGSAKREGGSGVKLVVWRDMVLERRTDGSRSGKDFRGPRST